MLYKPDGLKTDIPTEASPSSPVMAEVIKNKQFQGMNGFTLLIMVMAMTPWIFGDYEVFGFKITGWSWVIPLVVSSLICLIYINLITFPVSLWAPWIIILLIYWFFGRHNPDATQSLLQVLSPLAVGFAASIYRPSNQQLENIVRWLTKLVWIVWILLLIRFPMILLGALPGHGFMTAEMIGILLLGACYVSFYVCGGGNRHLYLYIMLIVATILSLTRGPLVAMLSCLPATMAPLQRHKRLIMCIIIITCALIIFNTDRMQRRMFHSGGGNIEDLFWHNPNLIKSGRESMWETLWHGVAEKPYLGNGWNSHRIAILQMGYFTYAPHNDWLKLLYDIGCVGTSLYLISMIFQMFYLIKIARQATGAYQMLVYGAASAFVPYSLIMLTDNVILYVQFFGNLHFTLIGIIYGALRQDKVTDDI